MSNKIFYSSPRARFFDNNGNPLSNGRVSFYEAGTTTLKTIYTDINQTTPAQNPALLDAEGYVRDQGIWLGGGRYKFKLDKALVSNPDVNEDADFSLLWTMDNVEGASVLNSGELSTIVVATIADLRALTAGEYSLVYVAGYWEENDGGGGWFNYSPNENEADNGGTVISPNDSPATGRFLRNLENWEVSVQYFGATSTSPNVVGSYCQNALTWCLANDRTLVFPADTYTFGSSQTFQGNLTIRVKENAVFTSEGTSIQITLSPTTLNVEGKTNHLGDDVELYFTPTTPTTFRPEHWGAIGDGVNSDADFKGFINADGRYGDSILTLSGDYIVDLPIGNPTNSFSTQRMHIELGATLTTDISFNMGSYTFDEGVNSVWMFAKSQLASMVDSTLYLDHFNSATPIGDSDFDYFKDAVTNNGARHGSFKLLTGGSYGVVGITATPSYSMDLFIKVGNKISAVTESQLPRLTNGVNDFDILDANGADIGFSNNAHSILWWGASTTTTTNNQFLGLKKALECASLSSNRGVVYGNNEVLSLTSTLSVSNLNVELRDLEVSITGGSFFTCSSSDIEVVNCRLTGINFTSCTNVIFDNCKLFGSTDHTITSDLIEISRCNFVMNSSETLTLTAVEELYFEGNRSSSGRFNFTTGSSTNVISNNRFNGLVRSGSGTENQSFVSINGGSSCSYNSNSFKVVNNVSSQGTSNVLHFKGSGQSVEGIVCSGNTFIGDGTVGSVNPIWASGYANSSHRAKIVGNSTIGIISQLVETRTIYTTNTSGGNSDVHVFKTIFPWSSNDYEAFLISSVNAIGETTATNPALVSMEITLYNLLGGMVDTRVIFVVRNPASINNISLELSTEFTI